MESRGFAAIRVVICLWGLWGCSVQPPVDKNRADASGEAPPAPAEQSSPGTNLPPADPTTSTPPPPPNLDPTNILMFVGQPDDVFHFSGTGAPVSKVTSSPAMPDGISLVPADRYGRLEGTPTAPSPSAAYSIEVGTTEGTTTVKTVQMEVKIPNPPVLENPASQSGFVGAVFPEIRLVNTGEDAQACWTMPRLPEGLIISVADRSCVINGTPLIESAATPFKILAKAADGSRGFATTTLTVQPGSASPYCPKLENYPARNLLPNVAMTVINFVNNGPSPTTCQISPPLPAGLSISLSGGTCRISGTPTTVTSLQTYKVSATGSDGTTGYATVPIAVSQNSPPLLSNMGTFSLATGLAITNIYFDNGGGAVTSCSVSPALPQGLNLSKSSSTCRINGTPTTAQALTTYTVTGSGANGSSSSATISFNVAVPVVPQIVTFTGTFQNPIKNVGLAPGSPNTIYVVHWGGMVKRSTDGGSNWTTMCQSRSNSEDEYYGNIMVSPGADATAYIAAHTTVDKIAAVDGAACPTMARSVWATYKNNGFFAFNATGRVYSMNYYDYSYSDDSGTTWTKINSNKALFHSMVRDPFDNARILMALGNSTPDTINGFTLNGETNLNNSISGAFPPDILMSPQTQGFVAMSTAGQYSTDGGVTWISSNDHILAEFDSAGNAYRFAPSLQTVKIQKSTNFTTATPTWTDFYDFGTLAKNSDPDVKINGTTMAVISDSRLFLSLNSGSTFSEITFTKATHSPRTPTVAASGNTIYIYDQGLIKKSTDEGNTWTAKSINLISNDFIKSGRLLLKPANLGQAYLHSENYNSTYSNKIYATTDSFANVTTQESSSAGWYSWASVAGVSAADPGIAMFLGWGRASRTTDTFATVAHKEIENTPSGWFVWYPNQEGHVSPWNSNEMFYIDTNTGTLWKFDYSAGTNTSINSSLNFSNPAGLDVAKTGAGTYELRVLSGTGKVDVSTNGTTFTSKNSGGGLGSGSSYIMKHAHHNPDLVVVAALKENSAQQTAYSIDGGVTWRIFSPGCSVRDVALTTTKVFLACSDERLRTFTP